MHPAWKRLLEIAGPYGEAFERDCASPRMAQQRFLAGTLAANMDTELGQCLGFETITTAAVYSRRVPIVCFSDIEAELSGWSDGRATLCAEAAVHGEWTSGSTREAKMIPYSDSGLEGFRHALFPWLMDLCRHAPAVADGRAYWALSPAGSSAFRNRSAGNDAAYFGEAAPLLQELSAVPLALAGLPDVKSWRFWTALFLVACEDLGFISIWSPTFLHPLLDAIEQDPEHLADALQRPERHAVPAALEPAFRRLQVDARRHVERLRAATGGGQLDSSVLWPGLHRISCWTHGAASCHIAGLAKRLPGVEIEPKGLLSTEAAVSVPIHGSTDPVAAVNSTFLELELDDGRCLPLWQWSEGDEGRVVVTTRSGLWRYATGDRIQISGYWQNTPTLVFLGRDETSVDLCGEKLDESLVHTRLPDDLDVFLAPDAGGRAYCLFLDDGQVSSEQASLLADRVDRALSEILHYRHARELGQLGQIQPVRVTGLIAGIIRQIHETRGSPLATIKVPVLDGDRGWQAYFTDAGVRELT